MSAQNVPQRADRRSIAAAFGILFVAVAPSSATAQQAIGRVLWIGSRTRSSISEPMTASVS